MTMPEWLIEEPIENKINEIYNPEPLNQVVRENIKVDNKQLNEELAQKIINPHFITDRVRPIGLNQNLDCHLVNTANSKLNI